MMNGNELFYYISSIFPPENAIQWALFPVLGWLQGWEAVLAAPPFNTFWRFPIRFRLHGSDIVCSLWESQKLLVPFLVRNFVTFVCFIYVYWSLTFFIRFNWFNGWIRQPDKFTQPNRQRPGRQTVWIFIRNVRRRRRRRRAKKRPEKTFHGA